MIPYDSQEEIDFYPVIKCIETNYVSRTPGKLAHREFKGFGWKCICSNVCTVYKKDYFEAYIQGQCICLRVWQVESYTATATLIRTADGYARSR